MCFAMITTKDVEDAQKKWGQGIVEISSVYSEGGDFVKRAELHIDSLYDYGKFSQEELNELMNASPRYSDEDLLQFSTGSPIMSSTDIKPYQEFSIEESGKGLFRRGKKRSGKK